MKILFIKKESVEVFYTALRQAQDDSLFCDEQRSKLSS